jgi:hypothetical protein
MVAAVDVAPTCSRCQVELEPVPAEMLSRERAWCGQWFAHPPVPGVAGLVGHTTVALLTSSELRTQLREQAGAGRDS